MVRRGEQPREVAKAAPRQPRAAAKAKLKAQKPPPAGGDANAAVAPPAAAADPVPPPVQETERTPEPVRGEAILRYNHYRHVFEVVAPPGRVEIAEVNERFSFSYGFKGQYEIHLRPADVGGVTQPRLSRGEGCILGVAIGGEYFCEVDEDPTEVARQVEEAKHRKPLSLTGGGGGGGSAAHRDLTQQLKGLSAEQLREAGAEYKQLLEARELEDCLFSGGGFADELHHPEPPASAAAAELVELRSSPDSLDDEGKFDGGSSSDSGGN